MQIDLHVHLADIDALLSTPHPDRPAAPARVRRWAREEQRNLGLKNGVTEGTIRRLLDGVRESQLDRIVLLALDAVFDESGQNRPDQTRLHVDNNFISTIAVQHQEFMFGASVHPYRPDALSELERVINNGACLIKWIPSGQHIQPDHPKCYPFYEALAHYEIPLLTHTGLEHTLGSRRPFYNHPKRLVPALERGVKVIAAHCGMPLFLHEISFFRAWVDLANRHEHLYGDSGAFSIVTRVPGLKRILSDEVLRSKLLYGSDFPGIPAPKWCWQLGAQQIRMLSEITNPLERNRRTMQALGMPDEAFSRAANLFPRKNITNEN
ncbi:MAG: amidohydrolase family protein [Pontiellaceae bacterium]|nr:amidohydrolase family protein [Pontiellaceae bacterium]